jgi:hypothetical protein
MILSVSVTIFESHPPVTILIPVPSFCFLIHSPMLVDLKPKNVRVPEVYTARP